MNNNAFPYVLMLFASIGFVWSMEAVAAVLIRLLGL